MGSAVLESGPGKEPISLSEAKSHLNVDTGDDDALIRGLIIAARQWVENFTERALITQSFSYYLDRFSDQMVLPFPRLQSVSAITYTDADGNTQTLSASVYDVDEKSEPGRVVLGYSQTWPTTREVVNAVRIQFTAGYGNDMDNVPEAIRQAIKIMIGQYYENREPLIVGVIAAPIKFSVESLLWPYKALRF